MSERAPPEGCSELIVQAASQAGIGVALTVIEGGTPRNVWFNDVALELLGWTAEELLAQPAFSFVAPEDLSRLWAMHEARQRGEPVDRCFEVTVARKDGTRAPLSIAVSQLEGAGLPTTVSFLAESSARTRAEAALRGSEAQFRTLVEWAPDAVVISRRGTVVYANPAAASILGFASSEAMLGARLDTLLDPEDAIVMGERVRAMLAEGLRFPPREYRARRADGAWVIVEIRSHVIEYEGQPSVLAFGRDITHRRRLHEQLARADRLAALGTLAAGVAHEINNPLAFMTLGIEALEARLAPTVADPDGAELLRELAPIREGAGRVADIVRDLMAFSRPEAEEASEIELTEVVRSARRLSAHELRHRARLETAIDGAPRVIGRAGRIEQVLVNLLVNAAQAFGDGHADARVEVRCRVRDAWVEIEVEDNGPGIAPEILGRVFDPFFTTKGAGVGTGLGLSICHSIVVGMGGEITIDSAPGRGTLVRVRLPSAPASAPASQAPAPISERAPSSPLSVMIVDDEPALVRALARLLEREHTVITATSGEEALAKLRAGPVPDVVLCDLMMPGLNGHELYARIAERDAAIAARFVFMTGGAVTPGAEAFLQTAVRPALMKPFTTDELRLALRLTPSSHARDP